MAHRANPADIVIFSDGDVRDHRSEVNYFASWFYDDYSG